MSFFSFLLKDFQDWPGLLLANPNWYNEKAKQIKWQLKGEKHEVIRHLCEQLQSATEEEADRKERPDIFKTKQRTKAKKKEHI